MDTERFDWKILILLSCAQSVWLEVEAEHIQDVFSQKVRSSFEDCTLVIWIRNVLHFHRKKRILKRMGPNPSLSSEEAGSDQKKLIWFVLRSFALIPFWNLNNVL